MSAGSSSRGWRVQLGSAGLDVEPAGPHAHLRSPVVIAGCFATAAGVLLRGAKAQTHNGFKIDIARRAIVRTLSQAAHGTPQSPSTKKIA